MSLVRYNNSTQKNAECVVAGLKLVFYETCRVAHIYTNVHGTSGFNVDHACLKKALRAVPTNSQLYVLVSRTVSWLVGWLVG